MGIIDYIDIRRLSGERFWSYILSTKSLPRDWDKDIRGYDLRVSVTRLSSCPYRSIVLNEEYGSHYYLRGKALEEHLIRYAENYLKLKNLKTGQIVYSEIKLREKINGHDKALVYGFVDAIGESYGEKVIIETKSNISGRILMESRLFQLSAYLRLYKNMTSKDVSGFLIAYIEERDPPIGIRKIKVKDDFKKLLEERVIAFFKREKRPIDKNECDLCPIKAVCEYRTRNPYRGFSIVCRLVTTADRTATE